MRNARLSGHGQTKGDSPRKEPRGEKGMGYGWTLGMGEGMYPCS